MLDGFYAVSHCASPIAFCRGRGTRKYLFGQVQSGRQPLSVHLRSNLAIYNMRSSCGITNAILQIDGNFFISPYVVPAVAGCSLIRNSLTSVNLKL